MSSPPSHSYSSTMKVPVNPQRAATLASNISSVRSRITSSLSSPSQTTPRLVAVSKLKPASDILALHQRPTEQLHFGENYVQELQEKARILPRSIRWHFIGGLQSNKCLSLARDVEGLWAVESVDSEKKAALLEKGRAERNERLRSSDEAFGASEPLRVFIQVNTSGEESKSGISPSSSNLLSLARYIQSSCPNLLLQGVMTIGAIARSQATTPETENEDFITLRQTRDELVQQLGVERDSLELSMGMSEDFEGAIRLGSNEVRIGSTIFGERPPKKDAKILDETSGGTA